MNWLDIALYSLAIIVPAAMWASFFIGFKSGRLSAGAKD